jgi:hypothetical protein
MRILCRLWRTGVRDDIGGPKAMSIRFLRNLSVDEVPITTSSAEASKYD